MTSTPAVITSRDNALAKELKRLAQDGSAYRKTGRVWLEGEHLCDAVVQRGLKADVLIISETYLDGKTAVALEKYREFAIKTVVFSETLLKECSGLESPAPLGMFMNLPSDVQVDPQAKTVILDRLQDPGNAGSILRSAAAFGYTQVLALKGTVALWSPKVLRAGMGAHLSLHIIEAATIEQLSALKQPLAVTSSHRGEYLHELQRRSHLLSKIEQTNEQIRRQEPNLAHFNWVLGHEGQGASAEIEALAQQHVRIAQPGGQESLNVAAAAAIVLQASACASLVCKG